MFDRYKDRRAEAEKTLNRVKNEDELDLEKGDLKAIIIAAFITFVPVLLVFIVPLLLLYWLTLGRF